MQPRQDESSATCDVVVVHLGKFERYFLSGIFLVTFVSIGLPQVTNYSDLGDRALGVAIMLIGLIGSWLMTVRIRLVVGTNELTVFNPIRTRHVRLRDIDSVEPDYEGMKLRLTNGKRVTVVAVQRYNIALFLRRRTRADNIGEEILRRRDACTDAS